MHMFEGFYFFLNLQLYYYPPLMYWRNSFRNKYFKRFKQFYLIQHFSFLMTRQLLFWTFSENNG